MKELKDVPTIYQYSYRMGMIKSELKGWKAGCPAKESLERIYRIAFELVDNQVRLEEDV